MLYLAGVEIVDDRLSILCGSHLRQMRRGYEERRRQAVFIMRRSLVWRVIGF